MKLVCPDCGEQKKLLYPADNLADRIFEGVYFDVDENGNVTQQPDDEAYLQQFNMPKFLQQARKDVAKGTELLCPTCEEYV